MSDLSISQKFNMPPTTYLLNNSSTNQITAASKKNKGLSTGAKVAIGTGLVLLASCGIYIATRGKIKIFNKLKGENNIPSYTEALDKALNRFSYDKYLIDHNLAEDAVKNNLPLTSQMKEALKPYDEYIAGLRDPERYIVKRPNKGCTGPLIDNRIDPSIYYDLSKEADGVTLHGLNHMGGNWTGVYLRQDGRLSHCPLARDYISAEDFLWINHRTKNELFEKNMIIKRTNNNYHWISSEDTKETIEFLSQFTHRDKTYIFYRIGSDSLVIPSKTKELSPFQKDFIEAVKKGYSPISNEGFFGANFNNDYGSLVKGVKDFLNNCN